MSNFYLPSHQRPSHITITSVVIRPWSWQWVLSVSNCQLTHAVCVLVSHTGRKSSQCPTPTTTSFIKGEAATLGIAHSFSCTRSLPCNFSISNCASFSTHRSTFDETSHTVSTIELHSVRRQLLTWESSGSHCHARITIESCGWNWHQFGEWNRISSGTLKVAFRTPIKNPE